MPRKHGSYWQHDSTTNRNPSNVVDERDDGTESDPRPGHVTAAIGRFEVAASRQTLIPGELHGVVEQLLTDDREGREGINDGTALANTLLNPYLVGLLERAGLRTVGQVRAKQDDELLELERIGAKQLNAIRAICGRREA